MQLEIEATYEHGSLKLARDLPFADGQKVRVIIQPHGSAASRLAGLILWAGDREELDRYLQDLDEGMAGRHDV